MGITDEAWAEPSDVKRWTGYEVDADEVMRAQDLIELFAGATIEASNAGNISQANLRRLNRAVSYQAAWMTAHPDLFTNVDVDNISQDGSSHTPSHVNAALLAPLAKRHLDRL